MGQRVGAGDKCHGYQNLHSVIVDQTHGPVSDISGRKPQDDAAGGLDEQHMRNGFDGNVGMIPGRGEAQQQGEEHNADTVVEQRLASVSIRSSFGNDRPARAPMT